MAKPLLDSIEGILFCSVVDGTSCCALILLRDTIGFANHS